MSPSVLATAVELSRLHGVRYAAAYLQESGVTIEVALDLLAHTPERLPEEDSRMSKQHCVRCYAVHPQTVPLKECPSLRRQQKHLNLADQH